MPEKPKKFIYIHLPAEDHQDLKQMALDTGTTVSAIVRKAVREILEAHHALNSQ